MRSASVLIACVVMVGATIVTPLAQTLQEGTWEGTTVLPDGSFVETDFDVTVEDGELAITYHSVQGPLPLVDIILEDDTLSYTPSRPACWSGAWWSARTTGATPANAKRGTARPAATR